MLLPAGTYTWRVFYDGNESTSASGGTGYISIDGVASYKNHTVTLTKPSYCHCRVYPLPAADKRSKYTAQIELGSTATSYEPYHDGGTAQAPAPLFAVGNAADEFEAVSGVTTRDVREITLDSTWAWSKYSNLNRRGFSVNILPYGMNRVPYICNNSLIKSMPNGGTDEHSLVLWLGVSYGTILFVAWYIEYYTLPSEIADWYDANTDKLNMDNFKAWLSSHDVKVYYDSSSAPTISTSTPTQIALQAGNNTAMQTDGGRTLAELALTYENLPSEG